MNSLFLILIENILNATCNTKYIYMGIPAYFSFVVKNNPNIVKKINTLNGQIHNLLLDCNSIIYDALFHIEFTTKDEYENQLIEYVCNKINLYIDDVSPTCLIYIAFDGVAPIAKLNQQRNRRYKSWFTNKVLNKSSEWDRCSITPGTHFMGLLSDKIYSTFGNNSLCKISTSTEPGEGEHKLFHHVRNNVEYYKDKTTIVYGLDADLIMLCINHLHVSSNIYLFRETPEFIKHIDKSLNPNELYILDIADLASNICYTLNNNQICDTNQEKNKLFDYIFICFMLGNDFMPHFPHINIRTNGINILMETYKEIIGNEKLNLTDGKKIYWNNFRKFISYLAKKECELYQEEYERRLMFEKRHYKDEKDEDKLNNIPVKDLKEEKFIDPYEKGWQFKYYKILFDIDGKKHNKQPICKNYLEAIDWNFKYYSGNCPDWSWKYNYDYPPLLVDLLEYIPSFSIDFIQETIPHIISPYTQLAYVLPKSSLQNQLPNKIYEKLADHSDWYSEDCVFKWNYCRYFWEAHAHLPDIPIMHLEQITNI